MTMRSPNQQPASTVGGLWTIITLLYVSPYTTSELRAMSVRQLHDYAAGAYGLARHGGCVDELRRTQQGLAIVVGRRYSSLEHGRYHVARSRGLAISTAALGHDSAGWHPIELVPDACWAN
jgi:hypothetical protein